MEEALAKKDLSNFQFTIKKQYKVLQEYVKLLKLIKIEHQKLFNKNKILKEKLKAIERKNKTKQK